ncbi:MAG: hypothetical protein M3044_15790 [Thermoproteota archaeon]|nr:hypothetical protein [Thermoproteota archaeon]
MTRECQESMIELILNGPSVMAVQDLTNRAEQLGIDTSDNYKPLALSEEQQIHNYINKKYTHFDGTDIGNDDNNNNSNESSELS